MALNLKLSIIRVFFCLLLAVSSNVFSSVAYLAHTEGYWQVWLMDADGENHVQISKSPYDKSHLSWYPGGKYLLVNGSQGELFKIDVKNGNEIPVDLPLEGTVDAVISPDGRKIVFSLSVAESIDNNHIWVVDENGKNLIKLTNMGGLQHEPVWSPDGQWVYFLSTTSPQSHDIWRVSVKDKRKEQLTIAQLYQFDLAVAQSNKIAFSSNRSGNYEIWVNDNGKLQQITQNQSLDARPTWSPDSKKIIYASTESGRMNIWHTDLETGKKRKLTDHPVGARYPVWLNHQSGVVISDE